MTEISNPQKILYPEDKFTKLDILNYYSSVADKMIPLIKDRPLALERFPDGITSAGFYQKNTPDYYPSWIKRKRISDTNYTLCNNKKTLLYLANQAAIVIHSWQSRIDKVDKPDKIVFDLDPPSPDKFSGVVKAADALHKLFDHLSLPSFLLSTGSRGLHIVLPIKPEKTFREIRDFASSVAEFIVTLDGEKYTTELRIQKRDKKIFIDVLRNTRSQLSIVPYSLRAKSGAPIAAPLSWSELSPKFKHSKYNLKNPQMENPWEDFSKKISIISAIKKFKSISSS